MKFHVNSKGEAGVCKAQNGGCPFGGEAEHYSSGDEARAAFEAQMEAQATPLSKVTDKVRKAFGLEAKPKPEFHAGDNFTKMVLSIEAAGLATATDRELDQAEYNFNTSLALSGESAVLPESYKELYDTPELENSTLTLANWTPTSNTQKFIVHELVRSAHSHHFIGMEKAGLRPDRIFEALQKANEGDSLAIPTETAREEGKLEPYDQGYIYGFTEAARAAMRQSFDESSSRKEQMAKLKSFIQERASFMTLVHEEGSNFDEGTLDSHIEWLEESADWRVEPNTPVYE